MTEKNSTYNYVTIFSSDPSFGSSRFPEIWNDRCAWVPIEGPRLPLDSFARLPPPRALTSRAQITCCYLRSTPHDSSLSLIRESERETTKGEWWTRVSDVTSRWLNWWTLSWTITRSSSSSSTSPTIRPTARGIRHASEGLFWRRLDNYIDRRRYNRRSVDSTSYVAE